MLHRELLEFFSWKTRTYLLGLLLFTVTIPYLKASSKGLFHSDVPVFPSHMLGHWTIRKKETKGKKEQSQSSIVVCVFSLSILSYIWNICFISNQYQIWDWQVQHGGGGIRSCHDDHHHDNPIDASTYIDRTMLICGSIAQEAPVITFKKINAHKSEVYRMTHVVWQRLHISWRCQKNRHTNKCIPITPGTTKHKLLGGPACMG